MSPSASFTTQQTQVTGCARQWHDLGIHCAVKLLILSGAFYLVFHAELTRIMGRWVSDPSWSHGFLIPLFSLYFVNQRKAEILATRTRPSYLGLPLLIAAIAFYVFNTVSPSGYAYFRSLAMIGALACICLFLGGWGLMRWVGLPVVYLLFAVPLPQRTYVALTMPMRQLAATIAAALLNLTQSVQTSVSGVVIDIFYQGQPLEPALNVAQACSGMRLLMAFLALGVAKAYLHERVLWQRGVLLVSSIPIAIFCNVVRVTVTGFIYVFVHPRYTQGIYHDVLGMTMLPLAFGLYGVLAWFMTSLFVEESQGPDEALVVKRTPSVMA
jgi:exosortase